MTTRQALAIDGGTPVRTAPFPRGQEVGPEEEAALISVLRSGHWGSSSGSEVREFESEFAAFQEAPHATAVANGTLALVAALRAIGVKPGDEVIVPPYTFIASASAVVLAGAVPVFADVDPDTMLLDAAAASRAVTERTVGIMPVHIGGRPCDMDAITALAQRHGLFVLEDAAQATGAEWRGRKTGTIGDLGTFSFQSSKILTAGEGGMITTADDALADLVWSMANVGRIRGGGWYQHEFIAFNLRMTEFQGALLRSQLRRYPAQALRRARRAGQLDERLGAIDGVRVPPADDRVTSHSHALYTFRLPPGTDKQWFLAAVRAEGIPAEAGYVSLNRIPVLLQAAREASGRPHLEFEACPVSAEIESDVIWLHHNVLLGDDKDIDDVVIAVSKVLGAKHG